MKIWIVVVYILLSIQPAISQTKRALIVGIGDYPIESGWCKINGDNDIIIVASYLQKSGYNSENIVSLSNKEATKSNIINALSSMAKESSSGDIVYIHFSTHGQRVTDLNGDETDSFDEAIAPFDSQQNFKNGFYEGGNHIVDDELSIYLSQISNSISSSGHLFVVIDACHSGGASRYEDSVVPMRGAADDFLIPRNSANQTGYIDIKHEWIEISACKSYQTNYECRVGSEFYGSLSYALYNIITQNEESKHHITLDEITQAMNKLHDREIIQSPEMILPDGVKHLIFQ